MMNNQEAFDKVKTHLLTQGKKSVDGYGHCLYRGLDGASCAIGCLIPDNLYSEDFEGLGYLDIRYKLKSVLGGVDYNLLNSLQILHDECEPIAWEKNLQEISEDFGLNNTKIA